MHDRTTDVESALGPALEATHMLMKVLGGKLSVFLANLPSLGSGRLKNREDAQKLNTDQEHTQLVSATDYYGKLAVKMVGDQIGVDMWYCPISIYYTTGHVL